MTRAPVILLAALLAAHCSSSSAPAAPRADGGPTSGAEPPSCVAGGAGRTTCGSGAESCCTTLAVPSGSFYLSYDGGRSTNGSQKAYASTVSAVALDRYEVTVGRFRAFVAAELGGWTPASGSGKHSHLAGGKGLNGGTELGWDASWSANLAHSAADWSTLLACDPTDATWTVTAGAREELPINCVDWYEAYAFCIWDGGFLPSEAEWNYTASGGADQRVYPWSEAYPPGSTALDCSHADYSAAWPTTSCVASGTAKVGAYSPDGDGKWGHADMAGNVFEWTLDWYAPYAATCDDCADLTAASNRVIRGGSFSGSPACLLNALRETSTPVGRSAGIGLRCARPPG